jgi:hypothetical protein
MDHSLSPRSWDMLLSVCKALQEFKVIAQNILCIISIMATAEIFRFTDLNCFSCISWKVSNFMFYELCFSLPVRTTMPRI